MSDQSAPQSVRPESGPGVTQALRPGSEPGVSQAVRPGSEPGGEDTGHPAVDAVLRSLANAARLAPAEQIAEYEAAHQVLQDTLASIDR
ncbi:hypothetical protein [Actinoplanes xinjiangensis]|uniref:hypothetical protein n=1 Tax=Actinoplanes xinjiangensis TaxID=512350 RepID=UPI00341CC79D